MKFSKLSLLHLLWKSRIFIQNMTVPICSGHFFFLNATIQIFISSTDGFSAKNRVLVSFFLNWSDIPSNILLLFLCKEEIICSRCSSGIGNLPWCIISVMLPVLGQAAGGAWANCAVISYHTTRGNSPHKIQLCCLQGSLTRTIGALLILMFFRILTMYRSLASIRILLTYLTWLGPTTHGAAWAGKTSALVTKTEHRNRTEWNHMKDWKARWPWRFCVLIMTWFYLHYEWLQIPYIPFALVKDGIDSYPSHVEHYSLPGKKPKRWLVREGRGEGGQGEYKEDAETSLKL